MLLFFQVENGGISETSKDIDSDRMVGFPITINASVY